MYLDGGNNVFAIQAPGTLHKARWMAKILQCLKMVLLLKDITTKFPSRAIFSKGQLQNIYRFADFVVYIYVSSWFTLGVPQDAVANDLNICRKTVEHPNQVVSTSVI